MASYPESSGRVLLEVRKPREAVLDDDVERHRALGFRRLGVEAPMPQWQLTDPSGRTCSRT